MNDTKIQWHPGFVAAMELELKEDRKNLIFEKEYNLNTKPLEIDLLVIKKESSIPVSNEIGRFFRGHNILEYKSPNDHLDIAFFKTIAYASLYKSYGKTLDEIKADDVTMSIIRETKPAGLFRYFREHGYSISSPCNGIYYIEGAFPFPAQIVVTGELDGKSHTWLKSLSKKLDRADIQNLLDKINQITGKNDKEMASAVLEVSIGANRQMMEKLKGDDPMFETLMEIMEPKIDEIRKEERKEGRKEGHIQGCKEGRIQGRKEGRIQGTIETLRNLKHEDHEIKYVIMEQYQLTEEEAAGYLRS